MFNFQDIKNFEKGFGVSVVFARENYPNKSFLQLIFQFYNNQIPKLGCNTLYGIEPC